MANEDHTQSGSNNLDTIQTSDVNGLEPDIARLKIESDIRLAERSIRLEEMRIEHKMSMDNRIEDFREAEALRLSKILDSSASEHWLRTYWRPMMGWIYALICVFDFVLAPIMMAILPVFVKGANYVPWKSLTLENGGIIHLSFAAILGVSAWTRGQENILKTKMTSDSLAINNGNGNTNG